MTVTVYPFSNSPVPSELGWRNTVGRPYFDGVYAGELSEFASTSSVLTITIQPGRCGSQGTFMESTANLTKTVNTNAANGNPRTDLLVMRLDRTAKTLLPLVIQGTPAVSPSAPALTKNDSMVDFPLYEINLNANGTSIANLADARQYAPLVSSKGSAFSRGLFLFESAAAVGYRGLRTKVGAAGAVELVTTSGGNSNPYIAIGNYEGTQEAGRFDVAQGTLRIGGTVTMGNAQAGVLGLSSVPNGPGVPTSGGYLYCTQGGSLAYRGPGGTVTTLAPA